MCRLQKMNAFKVRTSVVVETIDENLIVPECIASTVPDYHPADHGEFLDN